MVCGALLSGWRGGSVMRKLLTALPDGGVSALSGLQDAQTVGRISVAPSGRKFLLLTIVLFLITFATHARWWIPAL